jgi:hypothetical protein
MGRDQPDDVKLFGAHFLLVQANLGIMTFSGFFGLFSRELLPVRLIHMEIE